MHFPTIWLFFFEKHLFCPQRKNLFFRKIPEDLLKILLFLPSGILGHPVSSLLHCHHDMVQEGPGETPFVLCGCQHWGCTFQDAKCFPNQKQKDLVRWVGIHISVKGETANLSLSLQAFMCVLKDFTSMSGFKPSYPGPPPQILSAMS